MLPKDGRSEARESRSTDEVDIRARHLSAMLASLAALQRSAALCDVLLQVEPESTTSEAAREAAGTGVWAHRAVLGAASPYFHNIFENSDQQCKRLVIMVPRVTSKTLRMLVDNVYTPTSLSVTVEEGKSLLAAATHLSVADVRDEATTCLARSLAVDNVLGIYVTAESNDCPALTALAANFMQKNGEHVLQVDELLSLQPSMLGELLAGGRLAAPAQSALKAVLRWTMHRPQERRQHLSSLLEVVQLPQVPRPLLFEITRKEPIVNNAYALRLIILACLTDTDHDTQENTKNKKKSGRRVESELAFSRTSSEHCAVVSTAHTSLAVGDCNKNAEIIPDVSSSEHRAVASSAQAPLAVGDCNKNTEIITDVSSSEHRAVASSAQAPLAVGDCNKNAEIIPDVSSSEHRAVASSAQAPLAVGDCNKNAEIIPDVPSSEHRAVASSAQAPLAVGDCNKNAEIIPDVPSSEHRAIASSAQAPLAVGDSNKNAEIIPDVSSSEHRAVASSAQAPLAVGDCNKNAEIIPDVPSSEHRAVASSAQAPLAVGDCNKNAEIIPDVSSSEYRAVASSTQAPLAVGDCNKNAEIIPDVSSSEHRAVASSAQAPLAVGDCNKNAEIIPDVSSSEHRAVVSTAHASLAVGDCNKNAEINPDMSSGSRQSETPLSAARTAAGVAVLDDNVFKGTKNEQKSGRRVESNVEESALRVVEATADNAQALLSAAATQLGVGGVRDAVCDFLEHTLAADNALGIRAFAEQHACVALAAAATRYINTHFEHVLQADELLALAPDALATLLESLAVPAEERVLDAVLRWTQHRPQERQQYLFGLLRHVRLPLLSPEELTKRAHAEPLATAEPRVQRQLFDALSFHHTSSEHRALFAAGSEWYRPRQHRAANSGHHALLVVGGYNDSTGYTSDVSSFELSSGRWQSAAALPAARTGASVAVLDGRVYVVGGYDGDLRRPVNTMFVYDVARGSWSSGPSLTTSRSQLAAAALDGVLYAVGGRDSRGAPLSSVEAFDPREGVWRSIASMSTARGGLGVATLDGRVYTVGGLNNNNPLNTVERYDPSSARWETVDSMSERRWGAAVCVVDDVLYAAGGWNGSTTVSSVERYRAGSGWEPAPSMITVRRGAAGATHDGRLYVSGGIDDRNNTLSSVTVFSPSSAAWSELPAMPAGRTYAAAVVVHWPPTAP